MKKILFPILLGLVISPYNLYCINSYNNNEIYQYINDIQNIGTYNLKYAEEHFFCDGDLYFNSLYKEDFLRLIRSDYVSRYSNNDTKYLENGDVTKNIIIPSSKFESSFYECEIKMSFFDNKIHFNVYNIRFYTDSFLKGKIHFDKAIKGLDTRNKKHKQYLEDFEIGINKYLNTLFTKYDKENNLDNGRSVESKMVILKRSGIISNAVGFYYDKQKDEWLSDNNKIPKGENSNGFLDFRFLKVSYKGNIWYPLIIRSRVGFYKYPNIKEGYTSNVQTRFYIFTPDEYKKIHTEKLSSISTFIYGEMREENYYVRDLLSEIKKSINSGKTIYSKEKKFRFNKYKCNVRFLLPSIIDFDFTNSYYEIPESNFDILLINQ